MFHEIQFGNKKTYTDWGLLPMQQPVFNPPAVKTKILDIPGGDGIIDLTEAISGYPAFKNREGTWNFIAVKGSKDFYPIYDELIHYLHGQTMQVRLPDDDPGWYFEGRFWVNTMACNRLRGLIAINYSVGPYKWSDRLTDEPWIWDTFNFNTGVIGSATYWDESTDPPTLVYTGYGDAYGHIALTNTDAPLEFERSGSAPVQPMFVVIGGHSAIVTVGTETKTIAAGGSNSIPGLVLYRGKWLYDGRENTVAVRSGTVDPSSSETKTVTGSASSPATFDDGIAGISVNSLLFEFGPEQTGSGTPAPDNIKPISGISGITIFHSGEDVSDPTEISVSWDDGLGIIGAGTLNVLTGELTVTHKYMSFTGDDSEGWNSSGNNPYYYIPLAEAFVSNAESACSHLVSNPNISGGSTETGYRLYSSVSTKRLIMRPNVSSVTDLYTFTEWLSEQAEAETPVQVVYKLSEPVIVALDPVTITILSGENNIWVDKGTISVTYAVDTPSTLTLKFREGRL